MKRRKGGGGRQAERPRRTTKGRIERHAMGFCDKLPTGSVGTTRVQLCARHERKRKDVCPGDKKMKGKPNWDKVGRRRHRHKEPRETNPE